jgi:hypothetical protein
MSWRLNPSFMCSPRRRSISARSSSRKKTLSGSARDGTPAYRPQGVGWSWSRLRASSTARAWFAAFGYLINDRIAPVVDGEWTNYEPARASVPKPIPTSCWTDAPQKIPVYLRYLRAHGVGLSGYQPQFLELPGVR